MTWSRRMNSAIAFIEDNLESALNIEDVARVACCSKYHFHRMFFASFNVTCAEYIRRRKLTMAAVEVLNSDRKIVDIALAHGYDSPNAFTRAFRNIHGVNPSKARSDVVALSSFKRVSFPQSDSDEEKMDYKIVDVPEFAVIGKSKSFEFARFAKDGPQFWKEFVGTDEYQELILQSDGMPGPTTGAPLLSAYFPKEDGTRDEFLDVLGLESAVKPETKALGLHRVPAATYAEFACTYKSSMKTNRYIYGEWFSSTGYERDGNKPDIVAYYPIPFRPTNEMRIRWWIPIIAKR